MNGSVRNPLAITATKAELHDEEDVYVSVFGRRQKGLSAEPSIEAEAEVDKLNANYRCQ